MFYYTCSLNNTIITNTNDATTTITITENAKRNALLGRTRCHYRELECRETSIG